MSNSCDCGCSHHPDLGACTTFEAGMDGRCVYCDHADYCHPGIGPWANGPLAAHYIGFDKASSDGDVTVVKKVKIKKRDTRKRHKSRKAGV